MLQISNKISIGPVAFIFVLLALSPVSKVEAKEAVDLAAVPITTVKVTLEDLEQIARVQGDVETNNKPKIAAEVAGKIISMRVFEGESVSKGQVLAEQDPEPLLIAKEKASAEIQRIKALIDNQEKIVARNKKLKRENVVSQNRLDDAETALSLSTADLIVVEAQLKDVEYKLVHVKLMSPFDGVIQQKFVSVGDYVKVGSPVYQVVSLQDIYARIYLPETLIHGLDVGAKVTLIHDGRSVEGRLKSLRPMLEKGNRALHALIEFNNSLLWKPGLNIVAKVLVAVHKNALTVPVRALVMRPAGTVIYKILKGKAVEQRVVTGLRQDGRVEIVEGLAEGDIIALDGAPFLSKNVAVKVRVKQQ